MICFFFSFHSSYIFVIYNNFSLLLLGSLHCPSFKRIKCRCCRCWCLILYVRRHWMLCSLECKYHKTSNEKKPLRKKLHYSSSWFSFSLSFSVQISHLFRACCCALSFVCCYFTILHCINALLAPLELALLDRFKFCALKTSITHTWGNCENTACSLKGSTDNIREFCATYTLNNCTFVLESFIIHHVVNRKTRPSIRPKRKEPWSPQEKKNDCLKPVCDSPSKNVIIV